ncbi:MAG: tail fiber domain-containing protein [Bacteroidota bacterium]
MKRKQLLTFVLSLCSIYAIGQQPPTPPTPTDPTTGLAAPQKGQYAWFRGGNAGIGNPALTNNIFGTLFNSPIYTVTDGAQRTRLNGNLTTVINTFNVNTSGFFGISPSGFFATNSPASMLHLAGNNNTPFGAGGYRSWMRTGTLSTENSDNTYFGLKEEGFNRSDAIINWGDDANTPVDHLRFIFTSPNPPFGTGNASTVNGMEMARMSPIGNTGFGNYYFISPNAQAVRKVEILDVDPNSPVGANTNAPQLRTTYTYNANATLGIFTEFQTTSLGDMYFNTRSNTNVRRFGFHTSTPGNTVEINSPAASPIPGSSGLRFTDLRSTSTVIPNPGTGVLSVNATGDVILVPGGNNLTADNGVSINAGVIQLGVACSNIGGLLANSFTVDRAIANRNQNFWIASLNNETGGVGIGGQPNVNAFCNTGNTLEISANSKNAQYGSTNASGLRFTKLTSASPTIANTVNGVNSSKVLTVDGDGDVVLTNASPTSTGFGSACGSPAPVQLTANSELQLNSFNFNFTGNGQLASRNNVGIGLTCGTPGAKLDVLQSSLSSGSIGINVLNTDLLGIGIKSVVNNTGFQCHKIAGWFEATPAPCFGGVVQYAIIVPPSGGYSGFGTVNPTATVEIAGSGIINGAAMSSDASLKTNVNSLDNSLNKILKLRGVSFDWIPSMLTDTFMYGKHLGFIAQEVETIIPEVVRTTNNGFNTVSYTEIIPLLAGAIKDQQKQIQNKDSVINVLKQKDSLLDYRLTALESAVKSCCKKKSMEMDNSANNLIVTDVKLANAQSVVLEQNVPNPFAEQTTINYFLPDNTGKAQLLFYNNDGKLIQSVDLTQKGQGQLNVFANDLSNGVYTYTLIVDGKIVESKKMIKQ